MSIIYEALQKTQHKRKSLKKNSNKKIPRLMDYTLLATIVVLLILVIVSYYPFVIKLFTHTSTTKAKPALIVKQAPIQPVVRPPSVNEADYKSKHVLNGVFVSDQEKTALINNKMYHLGDLVDEMKITQIDLTSVKVQKDDQVITLKTLS